MLDTAEIHPIGTGEELQRLRAMAAHHEMHPIGTGAELASLRAMKVQWEDETSPYMMNQRVIPVVNLAELKKLRALVVRLADDTMADDLLADYLPCCGAAVAAYRQAVRGET